jgi:hypothetical protein
MADNGVRDHLRFAAFSRYVYRDVASSSSAVTSAKSSHRRVAVPLELVAKRPRRRDA